MSYCSHCGTELRQGGKFCPSCGAVVSGGSQDAQTVGSTAEQTVDRNAPIPTTQADVTYASTGRRIFAHLIDLIIVGILYLIIGYNIASQTGGLTDGGFDMEGGPALATVSLTFILSLLYFSIMEATRKGGTIGKRMLRIRVGTIDGGKASFGQALTRNLLRIVDGMLLYLVGLVLIWFSKRNQRLGDRMAGTIVVIVLPNTDANEDTAKSSGPRFSMGVRTGADYID